MTTAQYPLEWSARLVVGSVRTLTRRRIAVSCIGLVLTMLAAGGYIALGALRINPRAQRFSCACCCRNLAGCCPTKT